MAGRHLSTARAYRDGVRPGEGEVRFQVAVEQTDLLVVAEKDLRLEIAAFVAGVRGEIKNWIMFHPEFAESLVPVDVPEDAPGIVRAMAAAGEACGVGPMAAVAGAVAQAVGRGVCRAQSQHPGRERRRHLSALHPREGGGPAGRPGVGRVPSACASRPGPFPWRSARPAAPSAIP